MISKNRIITNHIHEKIIVDHISKLYVAITCSQPNSDFHGFMRVLKLHIFSKEFCALLLIIICLNSII